MSKTKISGKFVNNIKGYVNFLPSKLRDLEIDYFKLNKKIDIANSMMGELKTFEKLIPNMHLLSSIFLTKESLLSSQIEGTQSTLNEILLFEESFNHKTNDIEDVLNYKLALNIGIEELKEYDNSSMPLKTIKLIHKILMTKDNKQLHYRTTPGEFRKTQNWIGGSGPSNASFVPCEAEVLYEYLADFEIWLNSDLDYLPVLVKAAIMHYHFETIHPFLDGNGRIGRIIIMLFLIKEKAIISPNLFLSFYLKNNQSKYYDLLNNVRKNNDFLSWIEFFLDGIIETINTLKQIVNKIELLVNSEIDILNNKKIKYGKEIIEYIVKQEKFKINQIAKSSNLRSDLVKKAVLELVRQKFVIEIDRTKNQKRNKEYFHISLVKIIDEI